MKNTKVANQKTHHAIVIGGSMAGLLAARVLSEHFERVTIFERDHLIDDAEPRKGVPQGRHVHTLPAGGAALLRAYFPDLFAALAQDGAVPLSSSDIRRYQLGVRMAAVPVPVKSLWQSRPFLEQHVRAALGERPNVQILDGCSVTRLRTTGERITGVVLRHRSGEQREDEEEELTASLVVDAIGLGHAQRDVAIADELRRLRPDLEIDWLAQHPVTEVLKARGERIHPGSRHLANESRHIESESAEHDLHCFQAWRRMDEILVANYMLFHDVVNEEQYDLWIGDEAWELDYYLHENPEEKHAAYVWLTDFVGWLLIPDGGAHEAFLTADYNAEMIEQIERFPSLRDRAIFVGNLEDIVPDTFGADLPAIRTWTERHYDFAGYITGFDPAAFADREAIRAELGYAPDEKVCIVAVGGSGVGQHLLRRVMEAFPEAKRRVPELRMIVVAGPRIDPQTLPRVEGLEVRAYVYALYRHLAVCNLAVVQGGLTTAMELTANKRPFLYFPLRHHFEQNFHVRHRLDRYQAGRCLDFEQATPEVIAAAIAEEIGRKMVYRDVEHDGAARAATHIAELI